MGSISHHITPLVINSLGADTHTRILSRTEAILRNQARAGHRPVCAWFKKHGPTNTLGYSPVISGQDQILYSTKDNLLFQKVIKPITYVMIATNAFT